MALTKVQKKFIELEKRKEEFKQFKKDLNEALQDLVGEVGMNGHFQDEDGIVYQIVEPDGRFVYFDKLSYNRTKRTEEKRGSLSVKAAKELGYDL